MQIWYVIHELVDDTTVIVLTCEESQLSREIEAFGLVPEDVVIFKEKDSYTLSKQYTLRTQG
jgi:hypothetical protein